VNHAEAEQIVHALKANGKLSNTRRKMMAAMA
jgi:hypothetical protein